MLTYAVILLIVAIALVILEVLIPSGGILGFLSAAAAIASLVFAFKTSTGTGYLFIAIVLVCLPTVIVLGLKVLPHTPFGREMILAPAAEGPSARGVPGVADEDFSSLLGKSGTAVSQLRPSGIADIDSVRYSVVTQGQTIKKNTQIVVAKIEGNRIVVEPKEDGS